MSEEKNKSNKWVLWIGIIVVVIAIVFVVFKLFDFSNEKTIETYETKQYKEYLSGLKEYASNMDSSVDVEDAKVDFLKKVQEYGKTYDDGDGTGYANTLLTNSVIENNENDTEKFLNSIISILDSLLNTNIGGNSSIVSKTLTLKSYTVCETIGGDYCLSDNGLSANVYISDANSNKWAVLLHGVNMTGKQIYSTLGEMYTSQGYNVIAPDLRGAGKSEGKVAMGYLESLDTYDWIKDLNTNYARYGVNSKPETIVVHGVSLGSATTLQLATNPDIASASGGVYSANLTELNVKGFVDDCGYASMTGIITGMLSLGDSSQSTALLGGFDIDVNNFMNELQNQIKNLNIGDFSEINEIDITNGTELNEYLKGFSDKLNEYIENKKDNYPNVNDKNQIQIPEIDKNEIIDWWNKYTISKQTYIIDNYSINKVNNSFNKDSSSLLEDIIAKLLIKFGGIGLTEENYDKYANAFSSGRQFPKGSKVIIIHGDNDTMVPPSNADVIAANIGNAKLLYRWNVAKAPHAFIVVGSNKTEYTNLIGNFANCVANMQCSAFENSGKPLESIIK